MHELSITQSIVEAVREAVGEVPISRVYLEIGRLSGVLPDAVRFCFDLVAQGTPLEGARLSIAEPAGVGACRSCGGEIEMDGLIALCSCGSTDVSVVDGDQLRIKAVEVS